jgi:hypothetical protein
LELVKKSANTCPIGIQILHTVTTRGGEGDDAFDAEPRRTSRGGFATLKIEEKGFRIGKGLVDALSSASL